MNTTKKGTATKTIILTAEKEGKNKGKHEAALLLVFVTKAELHFIIATLVFH
jgi:hypothetical protein